MSYDDNGQLVRREKSTGETTEYVWNDQGMLVKVILPGGEPVEYEYDGNQRLTGRKSADGVDQFVQSGWDIVTKMDDVGKRTYYTGSSAVESEDSVKYFHYNHRGDTVLVTDSEGNTLNNFSYEAYGKVANSEGIPVNNLSIKNIPNLFVSASGIRYDTKTDLHYMRFRWFSGEQMRFISADLLMDLNRYAYVSGNPVMFSDPMGLQKTYNPWRKNQDIDIEGYWTSIEIGENGEIIKHSFYQPNEVLIFQTNELSKHFPEYFDEQGNLLSNGLTLGTAQLALYEASKIYDFIVPKCAQSIIQCWADCVEKYEPTEVISRSLGNAAKKIAGSSIFLGSPVPKSSLGINPKGGGPLTNVGRVSIFKGEWIDKNVVFRIISWLISVPGKLLMKTPDFKLNHPLVQKAVITMARHNSFRKQIGFINNALFYSYVSALIGVELYCANKCKILDRSKLVTELIINWFKGGCKK